MTITLHNYEIYLLDHFDGKLSEELIAELRVFLLAHPELGISMDDLNLPAIERDEVSGVFTGDLYKFQTPDQELICNYLDGLMSPTEKTEFENRLKSDLKLVAELNEFRKTVLNPETLIFQDKGLLVKSEDDLILNNRAIEVVEGLLPSASIALLMESDPEIRQEIQHYRLTKLIPDPALVFENKQILKRSARVVPLFAFRRLAVAAALFLVACLSVVFILVSTRDVNPLANKTDDQIIPANQSKVKAKDDSQALITDTGNINSHLISGNEVKRLKKSDQKEIRTINSDPTEDITATKDPAPETAESVFTVSPAPQVVTIEKTPEVIGSDSLTEKPDTTIQKRATLVNTDLPVVDDDLTYLEEEEGRVSFWQRVTRLAGEANRLGVKAVDGEVLDNKGFRLSIKSISIEKK